MLDYCPQKLDLKNSGLSQLFCSAGRNIDHYILYGEETNEFQREGKTIKAEFDFKPIARTGRVLYIAAESQEVYQSNFLIKFFELRDGEKPKSIDRLVTLTRELGLDFIKIKELTIEKQKQLRTDSIELSKLAGSFWNYLNPRNNRRYCA